VCLAVLQGNYRCSRKILKAAFHPTCERCFACSVLLRRVTCLRISPQLHDVSVA
jgi:hypothetical protein